MTHFTQNLKNKNCKTSDTDNREILKQLRQLSSVNEEPFYWLKRQKKLVL